MTINEFEWKLESDRLKAVLEEVNKKLGEKRDIKEKFKRDTVETQRELWEEVGSVSISNQLDQLVDFLGYINVMKKQKRDHKLTERLQEKYERMLLSPYFGRIDFLENGEEKSEEFYIGISNLMNDNYELLVYDWRAPVSSMFYDYEVGEASYECPEGSISGNVTLKRQYKINNGKLDYMFDSNLKIDDEILQDILGKTTDGGMKAIVTTIQKEQNRIIRNEEYKNLIVQGPAGSGKTSVALHRIAYLLYKHRDKITPQNIIIFSPNQIFNDYIANVLPQLGEENMYQTTFKEYMHSALGNELKKEDYCDMMEYILDAFEKPTYKERINNIKYKSSKEFIDVLKRYVSFVEGKDRNFSDIVYNDNLIISAKELKELFHMDYRHLPLKRRLQKLRERILYLLEPCEKERMNELINELKASGAYIDNLEITEKSIAIVREETRGIYRELNRVTEFDLVRLYKNLFENLELFIGKIKGNIGIKEINEIKNYTLENLSGGVLYYEDQPPMLYLKSVLGDLPKTSDIKYVIIDEAQDYTPLQYEIYHQLFNHSNITMLGDINQSINPYMNVGEYDNLSHIFPEDNTCIINLNKSYRSTMEITTFSRRLLNKGISDGYIERSGEKPLLQGFHDERGIKARILEDIKLYKEKGYKSIGIITRTAKETNEVYSFLKDKVLVKAIVRDDDEYISDTVVIPAYLAKGLEFDVVIIYNLGDGNYIHEEERLLLYTAFTRALHILCVYYSGKCTPLLQDVI